MRSEGIAKKRFVIRDALLNDWDPIGIREYSEAQDEYDAYVEDVLTILDRATDDHELCGYLLRLEKEHMGLVGNERRTVDFARRLFFLWQQKKS
jgi:hypothetical protein